MLKYFYKKSGLLLLIPIIILICVLCYKIQGKRKSLDEVFKSPNIASVNEKKIDEVKLYSEETSVTPSVYSKDTSVTPSVYSKDTSVTPSLTNDQEQFKVWLEKKEILNMNVERVCKKYGKSLSMVIKRGMFMYESEHKILFCRNAKVHNMLICVFFL